MNYHTIRAKLSPASLEDITTDELSAWIVGVDQLETAQRRERLFIGLNNCALVAANIRLDYFEPYEYLF